MQSQTESAVLRAQLCWGQIVKQAVTSDRTERPQEDKVAAKMLLAAVQGFNGDAADTLTAAFEEHDRADRERRMREYAAAIQAHWDEAVEQEWHRHWESAEEPQQEEGQQSQQGEWQQQGSRVIVVDNLAEVVTAEMLEGTFEQIGVVQDVQMGDGCSWVEFQNAEDAMDTLQRFSGVELAGQPMVIRMWRPEEEDAADQ